MLAEGTFEGKVALVTGGGSGLGTRLRARVRAPRGRRRRRRPAPGAFGRDRRLDRRPGREGAGAADRRSRPRAGGRPRRRGGRPVRAGRRPREQRGGQLRRQGRGAVAERLACGRRDRPRRQLSLLARGRPADDRTGRRRRDPQRDRELRLDRRPRHDPLGRGEGRHRRHDPDARGRVGSARDPRELHLPRADRHRGRRPGALADGGGPKAGGRDGSGGPARHAGGSRVVGRRLSALPTPTTSPARRSRSTADTGSSRTPTCPRSARRRA